MFLFLLLLYAGPVCGTDSKTYPSQCTLETEACKYKNGVEMAYPGNCIIPLIPTCKTVVKNADAPMLRTPAISDTPLGTANFIRIIIFIIHNVILIPMQFSSLLVLIPCYRMCISLHIFGRSFQHVHTKKFTKSAALVCYWG